MTPYEFYKKGYYLFSKYLGYDYAQEFIDTMDAFFMYRETNVDFLKSIILDLKMEIVVAVIISRETELFEKTSEDWNILSEMFESDTYSQLQEER